MTCKLRIAPIDQPVSGDRVDHYDQLDERAKARLSSLVSMGDACGVIEATDDDGLGEYDIVKFTHYYQISHESVRSACD